MFYPLNYRALCIGYRYNFLFLFTINLNFTIFAPVWKNIRLGNLYLLYAEALNESGASKTDVLTWVDLIRERAGLEGVEESWDTYTNNKKYETVDGRREIIQQERGIELAFEAQRFWDLRRWKLAYQEQNKPITGWNTQYSTNEDYYTEQLIYAQEFRIRNYFWPILDKELYSNKNLVQNYGW